ARRPAVGARRSAVWIGIYTAVLMSSSEQPDLPVLASVAGPIGGGGGLEAEAPTLAPRMLALLATRPAVQGAAVAAGGVVAGAAVVRLASRRRARALARA